MAQPLVLGTKGIEPSATTRVTIEANFDATKASVVDPTDNTLSIPIDVNDQSTYTNATSATFYDSKGQEFPGDLSVPEDPADSGRPHRHSPGGADGQLGHHRGGAGAQQHDAAGAGIRD